MRLTEPDIFFSKFLPFKFVSTPHIPFSGKERNNIFADCFLIFIYCKPVCAEVCFSRLLTGNAITAGGFLTQADKLEHFLKISFNFYIWSVLLDNWFFVLGDFRAIIYCLLTL